MLSTDIARYYGFRKPFDFKVAIPCLLNICLLVLACAVSAYLFLDGGLTIGTVRFYFFVYIIVLLLIGVALSRVTPLAYAILLWCLVELGLALFGIDLFPENYFMGAPEHRFKYHPLLQMVPVPNWHGSVLLFDVRNKSLYDRNGLPINWDAAGGRYFTFSHNSFGLRGAEPTAADLRKDLIFAFGGSTTYDITVTQGATWVERLQSELGGVYTVLNFGMLAHSTTENLIDTAFYEGIIPKRPVCAIYYVGWNDIHTAHIEQLDRAYADYHLPLIAVRSPDLYFAPYSPVTRLLSRIAKSRFDSIPPAPTFDGKAAVTGSDRDLEAIFAEHVDTIRAINESRGIKTIFVGQVLNRENLNYRPQDINTWVHLVRNADVWPLLEHFNTILRDVAVRHGAKYIDPGIDHFETRDFIDQGHFSAAGSEKFAKLIAGDVESYCQRN